MGVMASYAKLCDPMALQREIRGSAAISNRLSHIDTEEGPSPRTNVWFEALLTPAERMTLDGLVAAHDPRVFVARISWGDDEDFLEPRIESRRLSRELTVIEKARLETKLRAQGALRVEFPAAV